MDMKHNCPTASVAGVGDPALRIWQEKGSVELFVKFAGMLGFWPLAGTGKLSATLPRFSSVTVCGLSVLMEPMAVDAKCNVGASLRSSLSTTSRNRSVTYTLPLPSTATPEG